MKASFFFSIGESGRDMRDVCRGKSNPNPSQRNPQSSIIKKKQNKLLLVKATEGDGGIILQSVHLWPVGKKVINTVHVNINPGFVKIDQM